MAIAAYFNLDIYQFDAINAFCNALIDELIYIRYPDGFQVPGSCLKLLKALYGMPRSALLWYNKLFSLLTKLGLKPVLDTNCLFSNDKLIIFFYVDDIVILYHPSNISAYHEFREKLLDAYKMREMGELKWFLGIRIVRDRALRKIWLCQDSYITKICNKYRNKERTNKTPLTPIGT